MIPSELEYFEDLDLDDDIESHRVYQIEGLGTYPLDTTRSRGSSLSRSVSITWEICTWLPMC